MPGEKVDRRGFFKKAAAFGAAGAAAFSFEEQILQAYQRGGAQRRAPTPDYPGPMPMGNLGGTKISRLIAGHNLVGGTAHARDLIYVSQLLRAYFTEDKILETFQKYEEYGINAAFLRIETSMLAVAKKYRERGGKINWIAQLVINEKDQTRDLDLAVEAGAKIGYVRGLEGDRFFKANRMDIIATAIANAKKAGMTVGLATHSLDPLIAAEKSGLDADFYMKTFNSGQYWSAGSPLTPDPSWKPTETELVQSEYSPGTHDNLWETTPKQTAEFFAKVNKPFVAYKVLAAGAVHPIDGFEYAFANGADFLSVGMYDFQIAEDVAITKKLIAENKMNRKRPWRA